jgi:hypothetical protein
MRFTVGGRAATRWRALKGRYSRTLRTPMRSSLAKWTTSSTVSVPDPMRITTRSASGWPMYSKRP